MSSIAQYRFPIITWQKDEKMLWNPIHRKALKNRPEERVRLRIIDYLTDAGWSKHRLTTEEAINGLHKQSLRTDIICYSQEFQPVILVECKAENVPIKEQAARQTAQYNRIIDAPYLLLTNGRRDYWFKIKGDKLIDLDRVPEIIPLPDPSTEYRFEGWRKRGFTGKKASTDLRRWIVPLLNEVWRSSKQHIIRYLEFKNSPTDLDISHYYWITRVNSYSTAITLMGTPYGGSRLYAVLNSEGKNRGVIEVNLDLLFDNQSKNTSIYSPSGIVNIDIGDHASFFEPTADEIAARRLPDKMLNLFENYSS